MRVIDCLEPGETCQYKLHAAVAYRGNVDNLIAADVQERFHFGTSACICVSPKTEAVLPVGGN